LFIINPAKQGLVDKSTETQEKYYLHKILFYGKVVSCEKDGPLVQGVYSHGY